MEKTATKEKMAHTRAQLTLIVWSMEPEQSLFAPTTNETTGRVWPESDAAGSKQLVATLNFHANMDPSYVQKLKIKIELGKNIPLKLMDVQRIGTISIQI